AECALMPSLSRNIGFRPMESLESQTAEKISAGRTGNMPMFQALHRARLLIGDQAIHFRQKHAGEFQFWDLGEQWKKLTGLPFVYALWLIRPEVTGAKSLAKRLRKLRDKNLASLDDLIEEAVTGVGLSTVASAETDEPGPRKELNREFLFRYFCKHLRFNFGKKEKQGLQCFADL